MKIFLSLVVTCLWATLGFSQTYIGKQKDIAQILENTAKFSEYVMAGDHEQIAASYTEDGKIFPSGRKIIEGSDALNKYWTPPKGVQITHHKVTPSEIKVNGKEAYDYGYYEGKTMNASGEESSWQGKYVIVWRKVGKDWKIYLDIWNRID